MIKLSPKEIYEDFKKNSIDKSKASELLASLIENPLEIDNRGRDKCVTYLGLIDSKENSIFFLLENEVVTLVS